MTCRLITIEDQVMSITEFKNAVKNCFLTDYDGEGRYIYYGYITKIPVVPSDIERGKLLEDYTHIVWFNK